MAVLVESAPVTGEARAATGALRAYAARHERVEEVPLAAMLTGAVAGDVNGVRAVAAGDLRVVEIVIPEEVPCDAVAPATRLLAGRGWDVAVLVPAFRLGEAHGSLRGAPCRLQPWWIDGGEVCFGAYEIP
jgi:hypothetical protein